MRKLSIPACAAVFLASCALLAPEVEVSVTLPAPPDAWTRAFPDLGFTLVYRDAAGAEHSQDASVGGTAGIRCSRQGNSPVLAYPHAHADPTGLLRPAGAIFPLNADRAELPLTWGNGPAAVIMSLVRSRGRDPSLFNAGRLEEYIAREPDPWNLDLAGMAQKIAEGTFCAYDVDLLPRRDVTFATGAGKWFSESPFSTMEEADPSGVITVPSLAIGMHGVFSTEGRAILVYVGPRETAVVNATGYRGRVTGP